MLNKNFLFPFLLFIPMFYQFPINYVGPVYRPPSEGLSFLVQVTVGCSWNRCGFCAMYRGKKYRLREAHEIESDIVKAAAYFRRAGEFPRKVFICDGDALAAPFDTINATLDLIHLHFPNTTRVGIYASARNILAKSPDELTALSQKKLKIAYIGAESGSDQVLSLVNKGNSAAEILQACIKIKNCGWKVSMIIMLGLGGRQMSASHCEQSSALICGAAPDFLSFLTTTPVPSTPYDRLIRKSNISPLTIRELLAEMKTIISGVKTAGEKIIFRSNHVSNLLPLEGILPRDSQKLGALIDSWIKETPEGLFPEQDPSVL